MPIRTEFHALLQSVGNLPLTRSSVEISLRCCRRNNVPDRAAKMKRQGPDGPGLSALNHSLGN